MVPDLYLARGATVELDGERGMALDHGGRSGWDRGGGSVGVLGGDLVHLGLWGLVVLLELLGGDFEVAGLPAVGVDRFTLGVPVICNGPVDFWVKSGRLFRDLCG